MKEIYGNCRKARYQERKEAPTNRQRRTTFQKTALLVITHAILLLYSVGNVRSFTPQSKRYVLPKYSNLDVSDSAYNGDAIQEDATNDMVDTKSNNTLTPATESKTTRASPLPTNTVLQPMTAPAASLKNKIPIRTKKGKKVESRKDRKMDLMWCQSDRCQDVVRERVVGDHNTIVFNGPATGQVAYRWNQKAFPIDKSDPKSIEQHPSGKSSLSKIASVLLLVKRDDEELLKIVAQKVPELTEVGIEILLAPELAAKLKHYHGVDDEWISLFEKPKDPNTIDSSRVRHVDDDEEEWIQDMKYTEPFPDLVVTLGGDGLLMYASSVFQGPIPPLLAISGGSLGFLTAFSEHEMTHAIKVALGMATPIVGAINEESNGSAAAEEEGLQVFPPNMPSYPYEPTVNDVVARPTFGVEDYICMTIRMRLDCRIVSKEGVVRARYNVLNEVVIDRGSSPYLAALECFCDDVHLTTVQADGVIFATPSGSTAYSMAAGGSVVHPAVPCILVTPICPHVLSFRSMVFPDHVVLRCYVPEDARSTASVAFDGKHRSELQRGDSVQIQMSGYPVPTINKGDHSSDWLESLKSSFNFNTRPRQRPL